MKHPIPRPTCLLTLSSLLLLGLASLGCSSGPAAVSELVSTDLVVGEGAAASADSSVSVHYTGWVYDPSAERNRGKRFDSSHDRGLPFTFTPGAGGVIEGWIRGIPGMRRGGVRELIIPAELAYADKVAAGGAIPANSALVFEIEMIVVRD